MSAETGSHHMSRRVKLYAVPFLILLVGVVMSVWLYMSMRGTEQKLARLDFERDSENRHRALNRELAKAEMVIFSLQAFCNHAEILTQQEFRGYCGALFSGNKIVHALNLDLRVPDRERETFERGIRRNGFPGYRIGDRAAGGAMVPAARRPEYFPIAYLYPYAGYEKALGYDPAAETLRKQAMDTARDTNNLAATKTLQLVTESGKHPSFMMFAPIYRRGSATDTLDQRRQNIAGYAAGVFYLDDIVEASLDSIAKTGVDTFLFASQRHDKENLMYFHPAHKGATLSLGTFDDANHESAFSYSKPILVAGQQWQVVYRLPLGTSRVKSSWHPQGAMGGGILLSMIIASYVFTISSRREFTESLVSLRTGELELERASLEVRVAQRTAELEKSQKSLQESLVVWRTTFNAMNDAVCLIDHNGQILQCNQAMSSMLEMREEELEGKCCCDIIHDLCSQLQDCPFIATKATMTRQVAQLQWKGLWLEVTVDPVFAPGSTTLTGAVHIISDITTRKQAEAELVKLSHVIDQSPVSIVITDCEGRIEFVNPRARSLSGYELAELLHQNPRIFKSGQTADETYQELWQTVTAGRTWQGELINKKKNGEHFWESEIISPIVNSQGTISHYVAIKADISEQKALEQQLRQAQKMEAIGQLAGGVAHDFNNILTVIIGYAYLLQQKNNLDAHQKETLAQIMSAAERAAQLTGGLLAFSRKQTLNIKSVDLNDIVRHLQKFLERVIGEDISLTFIIHEANLQVNVDSSQIEQIIINLATNARDAMQHGGKLTIETGLRQLDAAFVSLHGYGTAGRYAVMSITDTGCGMNEMTRNRIFEPFFTTKETGKGTGLGMAIVYGVVKQHSGFINLYSEPGHGTTFRIYLPLPMEVTAFTEDQTVQGLLAGGSETILVVEDDPAVRHLVASFLKEYGYTVILAEDGEEAVERFIANHDKIDLILMDIIMPKQNGPETARQIKRLQPGGRILFTSGYTADFIKDRGIDDEEIDLLLKPVQPMELLRRVREMLDK